MDFPYSIEKLSESLRICVTPEHRFGTDAFLLAHFSQARHKDKIVDLGTGCGIIPFLLYKKFQPTIVHGVDIQKKAIEQFQYSIELSGLQEILLPLQSDLNDLAGKLSVDHFDMVTCNPPYFSSNTGATSSNPSHLIARHELHCTIGDVCKAAFRLLKTGGKLCLCQRPERLTDTIIAMRQHRLEPKRLRFVAKNADTNPWLFLIEGKKDSKPHMIIEPTLQVIENGDFSEEMNQVYNWTTKKDDGNEW